MNLNDWTRLPQDLQNECFHKSLAELSATTPQVGCCKIFCINPSSNAGMVQAVDFDAVKNHWRNGKFVFPGKSADALIVHDSEYYLCEFKTGRIIIADILRKVYDSALALVEFNVLNWEQCKQHLTFILVGIDIENRFAQLRHKNEADYMDPSYPSTNIDPRIVTGQAVKQFNILSPSEFAEFLHQKGLMN